MKTIGRPNRIALLGCAALLNFSTFSTLAMGQAGALDPSFGTGGIVTTPNTPTACGGGGVFVNCAMAIQSDGKIVVAGSDAPPFNNTKLSMARYNTNGSLDSSFGTGGIVLFTETGDGGPAFGLAIQPDGKIVTAAPNDFGLSVFRYNTNGTLDASFGSGGVASISSVFTVGPTTGALTLLSNGKILVAVGRFLVQLLSSGQLDSTFGALGVAPLLQDFAAATALAVPATGQPLVLTSNTSVSATEYNRDGSLNTAFGVNAQAPALGSAAAIVSLSNGNLGSSAKFVVGGTLLAAVAPSGLAPPQAFVVARYNSNGTIDTTFGINGAAVTSFPGNTFSSVLALALQSNGDIVAAGVTENPGSNAPTHFALARYTGSGQLDTSFGNSGLVTTAFGTNGVNFASVSALGIQSDGKIVAVGSNISPTLGPVNGFTLARYLAH